jgi:TRAP transporter TAXI family solute receptor
MPRLIPFTAAALLAAACATVVSDQPVRISLATATPGGGFPVFGDAFSASLMQADPTLTIEPRHTKGSAENIPLLDDGKVDLALVAGEPAYEALSRPGGTRAKMKAVAAMYPTAGMFAVLADSPYRTIHDLKGKPVSWGARGSGFVNQAGYVLDALGLDRDRDFQAVYLERAGDGPALLREGKVAALWGGGLGFPMFVEVARTGARFIAPADSEVKLILAKHPFLKPVTLAAGSYPGQAQPIDSVGSWSFVYARADLPDDTAYRITRALHRAEASLAARLPQARETTVANTYKAVADPSLLHPGTLKYLREAGIAH